MTFDFRGRARQIFAILGGIVFLAITAIFPDLPFTEETVVLFIGLIGAYALGEGISGQTIGDNFKTVLSSQKFQALIAGLAMTIIKAFLPELPISDVELTAFIASLGALIVGIGSQK